MAHKVSGRWQIGLPLSLTTALLWGVLPLALKRLLHSLGPFTITWLRFVSALIIVGTWLRLRGGLPGLDRLRRGTVVLLAVAVVGLVGNYVTYLLAMERLTPAGAQTLIQLAPMLFVVGSVVLFRERFGRGQWAGFALFAVGLLLFFNQRLVLLSLRAALRLRLRLDRRLQRQLGRLRAGAKATAPGLLVTGDPGPHLSGRERAPVPVHPRRAARAARRRPATRSSPFCCLNTVVAYGAFAEALVHWEASRVSATLAVTPLITIFVSALWAWLWPGSVQIEPLNALSYGGAALVVAGSMLCALKRG